MSGAPTADVKQHPEISKAMVGRLAGEVLNKKS
jgi:hypothetical protein